MSANAAIPPSNLPYAYFLASVSLTPNEQLFKTYLAASYASRFRFNPHNLESSWYGFGYRFLDALAGSKKRLIVVPQEKYMVEQEFPNSESDSENPDLSRSIGSIHTAPALSLIPDFTMIYISSYFPGVENRTDFIYGDPKFRLLRIAKTYSSVPIIMEVKPMPSRILNENGLLVAVRGKLYEAHQQLMRQAALVFHSYPQQTCLLLIAMTGPFWTSAWVTPGDVPQLEDVINKPDKAFGNWLKDDHNSTKDGSGEDDFLSWSEVKDDPMRMQKFNRTLPNLEAVDYKKYSDILVEPFNTKQEIDDLDGFVQNTGTWSLVYQWGSIASNQHTKTIHNYLESICDNPRQYLKQD